MGPQAGALGTQRFLLFPAFLKLLGLCEVGDGGGVLPWFWGLAPFCAKCKHTHIGASANAEAGSIG